MSLNLRQSITDMQIFSRFHDTGSSHRKWPAAPDSPAETSTDAYRWWARDVAASLQQAVAQDVAAPKGKVSTAEFVEIASTVFATSRASSRCVGAVMVLLS